MGERDGIDEASVDYECVICGEPVLLTACGLLVGTYRGPCRYPEDPTDEDQGQHLIADRRHALVPG